MKTLMQIIDFFPLIFLISSIFFSLLVIGVANPVYAVLSLIALFISTSIIMLAVGAEFIALIYVLVYVGAVLILFLWVVMTMPIKKNMFLHARFTIACLFISLGFVGLLLFNSPQGYIKVFHVTADNLLFASFAKLMGCIAAVDYEYAPGRYYKVGSNENTSIRLLSIQSFVFNSPMERRSYLWLALEQLFFKDYCVQHKVPFIFKKQLFLNSASALADSAFYLSLTEYLQGYIQPYLKIDLLVYTTPKHYTRFLTVLPNRNHNFSTLFFKPSLLPIVLGRKELSLNFSTLSLESAQNWMYLLRHPKPLALHELPIALYSNFGVLLVLVALILVVSMIGAVALIKFQSLPKVIQHDFKQIQREVPKDYIV